MPTYELRHNYESYRDGLRFGPWKAGDTVNLEAADAEWVERDSPGTLGNAPAAEPTGPATPAAAAGARPRHSGDPQEDETEESERQATKTRDRQHRSGRNRGN